MRILEDSAGYDTGLESYPPRKILETPPNADSRELYRMRRAFETIPLRRITKQLNTTDGSHRYAQFNFWARTRTDNI